MNDAQSVASKEPTATDASKSALLIGNDPEVRSALTLMLTPEGWTLDQRPNQQEALALAKEHPFDLIVTGRATSGKDDVEFLRRIRRVKPHTKVIILRRKHPGGRHCFHAGARLWISLKRVF